MKPPFFVQCLIDDFDQRKSRNSRYSLRAYARDLSLDVSQISKFMAQKRLPTLEIGQAIAAKLGLVGRVAKEFRESIAQARIHQAMGSDPKAEEEIFEFEQDLVEVVGSLVHYQIMELTFVNGFKSEPKWIAKRLGATAIEVQEAIARLLRLGLLERRDGSLCKTNHHIQVRDRSRTTPALRELQKEILREASNALQNVPIEQRHAIGMTMAISEEKLPIAKKLMDEFLFKLCDVLEDGTRDRVFQLSMHLFPVDQKERQ